MTVWEGLLAAGIGVMISCGSLVVGAALLVGYPFKVIRVLVCLVLLGYVLALAGGAGVLLT